ncbi:MAG TPA: recombinase family protein [Edaphobacter sp.]|nr:recombinase family protein [Edaphobacter sp.]
MNEKKNSGKIRCGIYARSAMNKNESIQSQIKICNAAALELGWSMIDPVYIDNGTGGVGSSKRPGLEKLLTAVEGEHPSIDCLLIAGVDRLGRDISLVQSIHDTLASHGVLVYVAETKQYFNNLIAEFPREALNPVEKYFNQRS